MNAPQGLAASFDLESLCRAGASHAPVVELASGARRAQMAVPRGAAIVDVLEQDRAACCFLRVAGPGRCRLAAPASETSALRESEAGGWLLSGSAAMAAVYWLPAAPALRRVDAHGRILAERPAAAAAVSFEDSRCVAEFEVPPDWVLDVVAWRVADGALADELATFAVLERQACFLWGSHTPYRRPADVYLHAVHGAVYENRFAWPHKRRICSENDAHALYVALSGLERATGKRLYRLLKAELLLSVMARQLPDGGFRHGEWTERMETHFRFCGSAMHLFMDALAEADDPAVRHALAALAAYASRQTDRVDGGTWFLHDELELTEAGMRDCPFGWTRTRALGKSESNMLVLNTHLDTTIGLDRFAETTGDGRYAELVAAARSAARMVLAQRPAEPLYRLLFAAIDLTLLPSARAAALPLPLRALKRIASRFLIPRLHRVKSRFPRLVMPGGYIDRAVPLATWAFHYLTININDLVRFRRRFPDAALAPVIEEAVRMTRTSGVLDRWRELRYERYAIGFWAEALYQLCIDTAEPLPRALLADAMLALEELDMGLPPSLLGANCETVAPAHQRPCPSPADPRLRVANLASARGAELLVVNTAGEPVPVALTGASGLDATAWRGPEGQPLRGSPPTLPARGWALCTP